MVACVSLSLIGLFLFKFPFNILNSIIYVSSPGDYSQGIAVYFAFTHMRAMYVRRDSPILKVGLLWALSGPAALWKGNGTWVQL